MKRLDTSATINQNMKIFYNKTLLLFCATTFAQHFYPVITFQPRFGALLPPIHTYPFGIQEGKTLVFDAPNIFGATCDGSLEIENKDGNRLTIIESVPETSIAFKSLKVHGCGCYLIHSGKKGQGVRQLTFPSLQTLTQNDVGFPRIRSIFRIPC